MHLFCNFCRASLANDRHPDLTGILHGLFDLLGDVPCQPGGGEIVDRLRLDNDTHLASCLDGECLLDAFKGHGHLLERADPFDVGFQVLSACTGTRT